MPPTKRPTSLSRIVERYNAGESINRLSKELGVNDGTLTRWFIQDGVALRRNNQPPSNLPALIQRHLDGESVQQIAVSCGMNSQTLARMMRKAGAKVRDRKETGRLSIIKRCAINIPNLHEIAERHRNGEQLGVLATELGILRNTLTKKLKAYGAEVRSRHNEKTHVKTAELVRLYTEQFQPMSHLSERFGLSVNSIRHRLLKVGVKMHKESVLREKNLTFAVPCERELDAELHQWGIRTTPQKAIGAKNVDIALEDYGIAIEIESGFSFRSASKQRTLSRTAYLLKQGWFVFYILTRGHQLVFPDVMSRIFELIHRLECGESFKGKIGAIGGRGQTVDTPKYREFFKGFTRLTGF